ncbi:MAG TPA: cellulase family glycosylhydrolase [Actinoplanes sp.]|nr:cellulase family glycosylhydrolase [Actinoplanes sp.]
MRALFVALLLVVVGLVVPVQPAVAAPTDSRGREIVLRGFNVSGSTKLYENGLLPFRSTADAATAAAQMRDLTGANAIRFLISWEGVQPARDRIDTAYLDRAAAQIQEFTSRGIRVLIDYHQDLWSSYLFNQGSWYTGDGAPEWAVDAGSYPTESCGICILWGQNMLTNNAVRGAAYDFWRNRYGLQDAYLTQARAMLTRLRTRVDYSMVLGIDPFNEPFDGGLDGAAGTTWEATYLLPFYQRFRTAMDDTGWSDRPVYAEPLVFWNTTFGEAGGFSTIPPLGDRYVFNSHYYDGARITLDPTAAGDGTYSAAMNRIRDRATALNTSAFVSEFGNSMDADRTPWMIRSMYQGLDSRLSGAGFWNNAANSGTVLSATQWQWDVYSGQHRELMNRNPGKVQTEGDAWNGEDHSVIANGALRLDPRVLDRLYPSAVAGRTVAFAYEDLAREGFAGSGRQQAWLTVPARLPAIRGLTSGRQYGVLVWREPAAPLGAPTELHLPASFPTGRTVVVSDLGTRSGLTTSGVIAVGTEPGATTARRLLLDTAGTAAGSVHVALVVNTSDVASVPAATLTAARTELLAWAAAL